MRAFSAGGLRSEVPDLTGTSPAERNRGALEPGSIAMNNLASAAGVLYIIRALYH